MRALLSTENVPVDWAIKKKWVGPNELRRQRILRGDPGAASHTAAFCPTGRAVKQCTLPRGGPIASRA